MKLTLEQLKAITSGAVSVVEIPEGYRFYRFTEAQRALYATRREALNLKSQASSGMKFCFETDSESFFVKGLFEYASSRSYFSLDVAVNGKIIDSLDNFSDVEIPPIYTGIDFPMGHYEKKFDLGAGRKTVTVYLPWNKILTLEEVSLDDGASLIPIRFSKKLLAFGDSITQGFDAMRPSNRQIGRLAEMLGAEEISKAVGAEIYDPELAALADDFQPDYIVVAYGTNDFSSQTPESFTAKCNGFYKAIGSHYPNARIFAITPIWRGDLDKPRNFESIFDIEKGIRAATANMKNVTVIDGMELVPHETKYFADGRLHPNDAGFEHYFQNLWRLVEAAL